MINLPEKLGRTKLQLAVLADWIESSVLFDPLESGLSKYDVIDVLTDGDTFSGKPFSEGYPDEEVDSKQTRANIYVSAAWEAIKLRHSLLGYNSPFDITNTEINLKTNWLDYPAYSFCVLLAMGTWAKIRPTWANDLGGGYTVEGELFERLTAAALTLHFPNWEFHVVGWSKSNLEGLTGLVKNVCSRIRELEREDYSDILTTKSKDVGLDLVGYRTFLDARGALPILFVQCANGDNWDTKLETPNITLWRNLVKFTSLPTRGFAMPFSLLEPENSQKFKLSAVLVEGPFFDRYRLLSTHSRTSSPEEWVPTELKTLLTDWITPRIKYFKWDS